MSMNVKQNDFRNRAETRIGDNYIVEQRNQRRETNSERLERLDEVTRLYRHDWSFLTPGENPKTTRRPKVMNQVQVQLDDIGKIVSETTPTVRIPPKGDSETAAKQAGIREAIAYGYWDYNRAEQMVPITAQDIAGAGCGFWLPTVKPGDTYPSIIRLNPRSCYPTIINGELIDLMHITVMKGRTLKALKGVDLGVNDNVDVELIGWYDHEEWAELAYGPSTKGMTWVTPPTRHGLTWAGRGMVPIAFGQLDSFDGAIRGMFDGIGGMLEAKNRIAELILEGADQAVYAPIVQFDVENAGDFGPLAIINKNSKEAEYARAQPAEVSPQLFALMSMLEGESRAGGGYPATRQGEVAAVNPASAAFITSTQGVLTSTIRNIDRIIGLMREQANRIMFALDEKLLNFDKPLCRTVGNRKTYTPVKDIAGDYDNQVVYGAGAGLDKANQYVLALQLKGAQLISNETIMGMLSEVDDPIGEIDKIEREQIRGVVVQKFAQEATTAMALQALVLMDSGKSLPEVAQALMAQAQQEAQQAQAAQAPQGAPGEAAPGPVPPEQAQAEQQSLQQGGVPGQAEGQPQQGGGNVVPFTPPAESIFVNSGR